MTNNFRALCAELAAELDHNRRCLLDDASLTHPLADRARAALAEQEADGPAVPEGREPASVTEQPSDEEIMGLMPQQMHEDLACAARAMANEAGTDNRKAKGFMRIALNRHAVDLARAVLARWGRPAPAPPADGEVAEAVERLRTVVAAYKSCRNTDHIWSLSGNGVNARLTVTLLTRAAELLERQATACAICERERLHQSTRAADLEVERQAAPVPVPVNERLPRPSVKVLAHYFNGLGKERTICAIWVPAKTRSDSYGDDDFTEYDEESDTFYWPEGWYETIENWDDLGYVKVDEGEVIYWQPIPKWPAHALPLPEVGA